jgi:hypothetical protein
LRHDHRHGNREITNETSKDKREPLYWMRFVPPCLSLGGDHPRESARKNMQGQMYVMRSMY